MQRGGKTPLLVVCQALPPLESDGRHPRASIVSLLAQPVRHCDLTLTLIIYDSTTAHAMIG